MKLRITFYFFVISSFISFNSFSQEWVEMMKNPNVNFYETQTAFEAYWEGKIIEKGKGHKVFKRWEN
ncbi:MAG: hypothetical protein FJX84_02865, partial [Bacteroidetes bacterium]|nr:hypothetical protein [Bacteroidota bacterium]